jgi:hypothetical protein
VHWADDGLLDFLEELRGARTATALLVICTARPELLERRPGWGSVIELSPLAEADTRVLLSALAHHGIYAITSEQKTEERAWVIGGGPWTRDDRARILDYCQTDVDPIGALLERMLPAILARPNGLGQALLRGRYMAAVARIERAGVPIDTATLERLRARWRELKLDLVAAIDKDYGVFEGASFKDGLFAGYLADNRIDWPRTATGRLQLDQDTFGDMAKSYMKLEPLKELRHSLSDLRLMNLGGGPDGSNRTLLSPFGARRLHTTHNKCVLGANDGMQSRSLALRT